MPSRSPLPQVLIVLGLLLSLTLASRPLAAAELLGEAYFRPPTVAERGQSWLRVTTVPERGLAAEAGLRSGDGLVAVAGQRVWSQWDVAVLMQRHCAEEAVELTVLRGDETLTLSAPEPLAMPLVHRRLPLAEQLPEPTALCERWGVAVPATERHLLDGLPGRLRAVLARRDPAVDDPAWAAALVGAHLALARGRPADLPAFPATWPTPYLAEVAEGYRRLAEHRQVAAGPDAADTVAAEPLAAGIAPAWYLLHYPWSGAPRGDWGRLASSEVALMPLLRARSSDPVGSRAARWELAHRLRKGQPSEPASVVIALCQAQVLAPYWYRRRLQESGGFWEEDARRRLIDDCTVLLAAGGDDELWCVYGLVQLLAAADRREELVVLLRFLVEAAPRLAQVALGDLRGIAAAAGHEAQLEAVLAELEAPALTAVPREDPLLRWVALSSDVLGATAQRLVAVADRELLLPQVGRLLRLLGEDGLLREHAHDDRAAMLVNLNNMTWDLATDARVIDADQSLQGIAAMRAATQWQMEAYQRDTVAAAYARAGAFDRAERWQRWVIQDLVEQGRHGGSRAGMHDLAEFTNRLQLFRGQEAALEVEAGPLEPHATDFEDGQARERGWTWNGRLNGLWQRWHANGQRAEAGPYRANEREGFWRFWNEAGELLAAGAFHRGTRAGTWRFRLADGAEVVGAFLGEPGEGDLRLGRWRWYRPDGSRLAETWYWYGERAGPYRSWHPDGRPAIVGRYEGGIRAGRWQVVGPDGETTTVDPDTLTLPEEALGPLP